MEKVEVIKEGWGGHKKGYKFETHKTTAAALAAHKVVKILSDDKKKDDK